MNNTKTAINQLPIEVVSSILDFLDYGSMLEASLVCRDWNNIISTSKIFLNSTIVALRIMERSKFKLTRKYLHLYLETGPPSTLNKSTLDQISNVCESLETFDFEGRVPASTQKVFIKFLNHCVNLQQLSITINSVATEERAQQPKHKFAAKLQNLKYFSLIGDCDYWLLKNVNIQNLESLRLSDYHFSDCAIVPFMNKLLKLDSIRLNGIDLNSTENLVPQFKWKYMKIDFIIINFTMSDDMQRNWQNLFDVAAQDSKLSIESGVVPEVAKPLLEMIMNQQNITKMKLEMNSYPDKFLRGEDDKKFKYIKELKLRKLPLWEDYVTSKEEQMRNEIIQKRKMSDIMQKFENVQFLDLDVMSSVFLRDGTEERRAVFSKVKRLRINSVTKYEIMWKTVIFPSLETLELDLEKSEKREKPKFLDFFIHNGTDETEIMKEGIVAEFYTETGAGQNHSTLKKLVVIYENAFHDFHINLWRHAMNRFPSVQEFVVFNPTTGEQNVKTRSEIIQSP